MLTNAVAPDKLGGLERYVRELADALVGAGERVVVLTKQIDPTTPLHEQGSDGVVIDRHPLAPRTSRLFALRYALQATGGSWRALQRHPGAVPHAHYPLPALALALSGRRYLYTFHAPVHRELLSERMNSYALPPATQAAAVAALRALERLVVRRAARVVVLSEFMRTQLADLDARAARTAVLLPGGVDLGRFAPGPAVREPWVAAGAPLLFTARRLTPRTGVRELLQAMPTILRSLPDARLAVAGQGRMEPELRRIASALSLDGAVTFLGRISDERLVRWYRAADLVVMPTQELEGFGLTTAEALACGTPVLGTPVGATPELLAALDPALLTCDRSAGAIAAGVVALLADRARLRRIGELGRARVEEFGWPTIAARYVTLYRSLQT